MKTTTEVVWIYEEENVDQPLRWYPKGNVPVYLACLTRMVWWLGMRDAVYSNDEH